MFDRKEVIVQAIRNRRTEANNIRLMIDFYILKGKITEEDKLELLEMLNMSELAGQEKQTEA